MRPYRRFNLRSPVEACATGITKMNGSRCNIWWSQSICMRWEWWRNEADRCKWKHTAHSRSRCRRIPCCSVFHHPCTILIASKAWCRISAIQESVAKFGTGLCWLWSWGSYRTLPTLYYVLLRVRNDAWAFWILWIRRLCLACWTTRSSFCQGFDS